MPYTEPDTESLLTELQEILESNGKIPQDVRQRVQLKLIGEIYRVVKPLPKQVEELRRKNLIILFQSNAWLLPLVITVYFVVLEFWHSAAWRPVLYKLLGIPFP